MNRNVRKQSAVIAKQGKEPNHKIRILPVLLPTIMAMMLTLICFIGATWAWFSDTVQTGVNTIEAGSNTEITVQKQATDGATNTPVEETKHGNQYTYNLEAGTYEVTINPSKDLHQEFVVFELGTTKKYIQLSKEKSEETVTVHASENNTSLKITTKWGEAGNDSEAGDAFTENYYVIGRPPNTPESGDGNEVGPDNSGNGIAGLSDNGEGNEENGGSGTPSTTGNPQGTNNGDTGAGTSGSGTGQGDNDGGGEADPAKGGDGTADGGGTTTTGGEGDPQEPILDPNADPTNPTTQGGSGNGETGGENTPENPDQPTA